MKSQKLLRQLWWPVVAIKAHQHTQKFNCLVSGTSWVSRYQKGKTKLDFTEARDSEWQWHQLCHMQVCSRQITMPAPHHSVFYRPDALPAAQPTASKHWRLTTLTLGKLEVNGKPVRECSGMHWYMYEQTDGQNENIRHLALSIWWIKSKKGQTDTRQMHYTYL